MPFKKCPKCGQDVRQVDPNCWNCGAGFDGAKAVIPFTHVPSEEEERFHQSRFNARGPREESRGTRGSHSL